MVLTALVAGAAALVTAAPTVDARSPVRWEYINSDQRSPLLVGMPLSRVVGFATHHHIKLNILRVFESSPKGIVTEEPRGLPGAILLVVSKGPPANLWAVLPGAKGRPVRRECAPSFGIDFDSNASPTTCGDGDRVDVAAWDYFASSRPPMFSLGREAKRCQVAEVYNNAHLTLPMDFSVYEMAKAYYGWKFGDAFTDQLTVAGPYTDNCKKLVEPDDG
jgi:hypothetical protein